MRKLNKPIIKKLPPVKLYLDDIESIYNTLKEKVKNIAITTEDYAVEDIKQLIDLQTKKINELSIKSSDPYISVEFRPSSASIYCSEDTTYNRGILSEIEEIVRKRKVSLRRTLTFLGAIFLNVLLFVGSVVAIQESNPYRWYFIGLIPMSVLLSMYLSFNFGYKAGLGNYSTILLTDRKENISFWKSNRDQIFVALIAAIAGSLVTILLLWIFKSL